MVYDPRDKSARTGGVCAGTHILLSFSFLSSSFLLNQFGTVGEDTHGPVTRHAVKSPNWPCHASTFYHNKSNTQSIFLTLFCRPAVHEIFLILFGELLDFTVQFPGFSIIESIYTN